MFCNKCGKQVPNDALFCNHCGSKISAPQPSPQPAPQPSASSAQQAQKNASANKQGGCGARIGGIIFTILVILVVRYCVENLFSGDIKIGGISKKALMEDTSKGAIYQSGYLTYGLARLSVPGYTVENDSAYNGDYLLSYDNTKIIRSYLNHENNVSYDAMTKQSIQNSYIFHASFSNINIEQFSKYKVDGFHVIEYIMSCTTIMGKDKYVGELIVFPDKTPDRTLRFSMETLKQNGISTISSVFDSLKISEDFDYEINSSGFNTYNDKTIHER